MGNNMDLRLVSEVRADGQFRGTEPSLNPWELMPSLGDSVRTELNCRTPRRYWRIVWYRKPLSYLVARYINRRVVSRRETVSFSLVTYQFSQAELNVFPPVLILLYFLISISDHSFIWVLVTLELSFLFSSRSFATVTSRFSVIGQLVIK